MSNDIVTIPEPQPTAGTWGQSECAATLTAPRKKITRPEAEPVKPAPVPSRWGTPPRSLAIGDFQGLQAGVGGEHWAGQKHLTPQEANCSALGIFTLTPAERQNLDTYAKEARRLIALKGYWNGQAVERRYREARDQMLSPKRKLSDEELGALAANLSQLKRDGSEKVYVAHRQLKNLVAEFIPHCLAILKRFLPLLEAELERERVEARAHAKRFGIVIRFPGEVEWSLNARVERLRGAIEEGLTAFGGDITPWDLLGSYVKPEAAQ